MMKNQKNKYKKYLALAAGLGIVIGFLIGNTVGLANRGELPAVHGSLELECLEQEKAFQNCVNTQTLIKTEELKASIPKIDAFFPEL
jgi:hypothetical protein